MNKPVKTRVYQTPIMDSERWNAVQARDDDIFIATPSKSGTTWTQSIVAHLLFPDDEFPARI